MRLRSAFLAVPFAAALLVGQQRPAKPAAGSGNAPIPEIHALMLAVQAHQRQLDKVRENYTYRELIQTDDLDSDGRVKKSEVEEYEVFYVNSHRIQRLVKKNGKELSGDDQKKEQEHVTKEVEKATKLAPGQSLNADHISIGRILAIVTVSNPRRVSLNGRDTIAFDFVGDPHAQTHGIAEDASKKMAGTLWVDEKDTEVARLQVHFDDNFRVGAGLLATVQKGSSFEFEQALINNELWLPTTAEAHLQARVLLVKGYRQNMHLKDSDYQRFHTEAGEQPGVTVHSQ